MIVSLIKRNSRSLNQGTDGSLTNSVTSMIIKRRKKVTIKVMRGLEKEVLMNFFTVVELSSTLVFQRI